MRRREGRGKAWGKWRKLVREQGRRGQSVAAFCRERGLCAPYFYAWKKRLREAAAGRDVLRAPLTKFVEVRLVPAGPGLAGAARAAGGGNRWGGGARGDRRGSAERASVRLSLAARRPVENSALGPGRIRVVVQAAGGGRVQAAARRGCGAGSGAAGQRAGDDPGRDRCVEAEAPAALRAWRTINAPRAEAL